MSWARAACTLQTSSVELPPRNRTQETAFSVQTLPGVRFLVFEFAAFGFAVCSSPPPSACLPSPSTHLRYHAHHHHIPPPTSSPRRVLRFTGQSSSVDCPWPGSLLLKTGFCWFFFFSFFFGKFGGGQQRPFSARASCSSATPRHVRRGHCWLTAKSRAKARASGYKWPREMEEVHLISH